MQLEQKAHTKLARTFYLRQRGGVYGHHDDSITPQRKQLASVVGRQAAKDNKAENPSETSLTIHQLAQSESPFSGYIHDFVTSLCTETLHFQSLTQSKCLKHFCGDVPRHFRLRHLSFIVKSEP